MKQDLLIRALLGVVFPFREIFTFATLFTIFTVDLFNLDSTVTTKASLFQHRNNCLLGNGKSYHGKTKITKSGKVCVHWNKIPYLSNTSFPILEKNYCRNPEGYGVRPWCYVNMKNRTWEYCETEACEGEFFI